MIKSKETKINIKIKEEIKKKDEDVQRKMIKSYKQKSR